MQRTVVLLACLFGSAIAWAEQPPAAPREALGRLGSTAFLLPENAGHTLVAPDGKTIVSLVHDNRSEYKMRIVFTSTTTGAKVRELVFDQMSGDRAAFRDNGQELFVFHGQTVFTIDVTTGKRVRHVEVKNCDLRNPALSADGRTVAGLADWDSERRPIVLRDTTTGKEISRLPGCGTWSTAMQFNPKGDRLVAVAMLASRSESGGLMYGSNSPSIVASIDVPAKKILGELSLQREQKFALCPDGETVALADEKGGKLLHLPTNKVRATVEVTPTEMHYTPDGSGLVTVDNQQCVVLWNATTGAKTRTLDGGLAHKSYHVIGSTGAGDTVVICDGGGRQRGTLAVWDAKGRRVPKPPGHDGTVSHLAYTADGKQLVTGSTDRTVRLWNVATSEHTRLLATHKDEITALALSPDGRWAASASRDGSVRLTRLADGFSTTTFTTAPQITTGLMFASDGGTLYGGGDNKEFYAWRLTATPTGEHHPIGENSRTVALVGGRWLLTTEREDRFDDADAKLNLWHPHRKHPLVNITLTDEKKGTIRCDGATFATNGRLLATSQISEYQGIRPSYGAARLQLWEPASGQTIRTLAPVVTQTLAFSPNGRLLVATGAGQSGHLRIGYGGGLEFWDTLTGAKVGTLPVTPVSLTFSPDGRTLATGGDDHGVTFWKVPTPAAAKTTTFPQRDLDAWWPTLAKDASAAYKMIGQMLEAPEVAVAMLRKELPPVVALDAATAKDLIEKLDSNRFAEREAAEKTLRLHGERVTHHLAAALGNTSSAEMRARLERLLASDENTPERRRQQRAIAALEWLDTPEARTHLRAVAAGAPHAFVTREATTIVERLGFGP